MDLSVEQVAHAFLVHEKTMQQRLLRVKRKIRLAGIAYEIPQSGQLGERLSSVLQTIYLMFNEGYSATSGDSLVREPLCREAIHLSRRIRAYFPDNAELEGVIALMLLQDSRRDARLSGAGQLVLLRDQDRSLWNKGQLREGQQILDHALRLHQAPGPFQIQAAIAALHALAPSTDETDWDEIVLLYATLLKYNAHAVVRLNYLVARAMSGDVDTALADMASIAKDLSNYRPFFVARAELSLMADQQADATADLNRALELTGNSREKAHIIKRLKQLDVRGQ